MASTTTPTQAPNQPSAPAIDDAELPRGLVVRVAGYVYACDVGAVREVVPVRETRVTRLPGAPRAVAGLVNVRGVIVTVVDAGEALHGTPVLRDGAGAILVVDTGGPPAGALVDAVLDVRALRADEYERLDVRAMVARVVIISEDE